MKKLGERLAASAETSDADLEQLEEIIACHQAVLELARSRLDGLAELQPLLDEVAGRRLALLAV